MSALERVLAEEWPDGSFGGPRPRTANPYTPRASCSWCGQSRALNADGTLRVHRIPGDPDRTPCLGGGRRPTARLRTSATSPAAAARHYADLAAAIRQPANRRPARKVA
ncbi:hypothetical protein [Streptomyces katrae]|uniref:hypothetical protein n=1 Tax=Streptomyces katrae TaxID=68223 RepID=UPI000564E67A|nr:hypothetical protein [Streptomyces katrae]